jgi:hypothetical protein
VDAVKRIFAYLKGTASLALTLRRGEGSGVLKAFADADFAGEPEPNDLPLRSTSGLVIYLQGIGPIFSQSCLQPTISRSTAESEYKAVGAAAQAVSSIRQLLEELGFPQEDPTVVYNDNQACIAMTKNRTSGFSTRHLKIQFHYIRQLVGDKEICLEYCPTDKMIADIFTKALPRPQFEYLRHKLLSNQLT